MFKRTILLIFTVILSSSILAACGSGEGNAAKDGDVSGIIPSYVPNSGGSIYHTTAAITKIFSDEEIMPSVQFSVEAAGGSPGNIEAVLDRYDQGAPAIGTVSAKDGTEAYNGEYEYVPGEHKQLRAVGYTSPAYIHLIVPVNSDIKELSDLKGKGIGAPPGAAIEDTIRDVLASIGLEEGEDYHFEPYNNAEVQQAMQDRSLDAGAITDTLPSSALREVMSMTDIRILSLSEEESEKYLDDFGPYAAVHTISDMYDEIDHDVTIPVINSHYITHEDTPDELVYNYLKAMVEYPDQLDSIVPGSNISKETITEGIEIPLHPGAEQYLDEIGVLE